MADDVITLLHKQHEDIRTLFTEVETATGDEPMVGLRPLTREWVRMADQAPLVRSTRAHEDLEWWPERDARAVLREVVMAMGGVRERG